MKFANTLRNKLTTSLESKCLLMFTFAFTFAGNVQNMKLVQNCTGFLICAFTRLLIFNCLFEFIKERILIRPKLYMLFPLGSFACYSLKYDKCSFNFAILFV